MGSYKSASDNWLVISDMQSPFQHPKTIDFLLRVAKEFKIDKFHVACVGDEKDQYHGSRYDKDPDATHTINDEIAESKAFFGELAACFPIVKFATSNHGQRWAAKASAAQIPSQMLRSYQELIDAPKGWQWKDEWILKSGNTSFKMIHGTGYSGMQGHRNAAVDNQMNTVIGHIHSHAGIAYVRTANDAIWGMNVGCLIDETQYAFRYNRYHRHKPVLACGVVLSQSVPLLVPYF